MNNMMSQKQILLEESFGGNTRTVIQAAIYGGNTFDVKNEQILSDWILWTYLGTVVVLGIVTNLVMMVTLMTTKNNGTSIFIIQMLLNDLTSLGIATLEILYMNNRKWIFLPELCPVYLGLESITSTASVYFIIAINLHGISTYNLEVKSLERKREYGINNRSSDTHNSEDDYNEIVTSIQERSLTIDYSKKGKTKISVMFPIIFIWFLAVSVSVPMFTFGVLLPNSRVALICGIENLNRSTNILLQLLVFHCRIIIPSVCLLITLLFVGYKYLYSKSHSIIGSKENANTTLRLGLVLSITYLMFSVQRVYGSLMFEIMKRPFMQYKYPMFDKLLAVVFCMINYTLPAIRPYIYACVDKSIRKKVTFCCRKQRHNKVINV